MLQTIKNRNIIKSADNINVTNLILYLESKVFWDNSKIVDSETAGSKTEVSINEDDDSYMFVFETTGCFELWDFAKTLHTFPYIKEASVKRFYIKSQQRYAGLALNIKIKKTGFNFESVPRQDNPQGTGFVHAEVKNGIMNQLKVSGEQRMHVKALTRWMINRRFNQSLVKWVFEVVVESPEFDVIALCVNDMDLFSLNKIVNKCPSIVFLVFKFTPTYISNSNSGNEDDAHCIIRFTKNKKEWAVLKDDDDDDDGSDVIPLTKEENRQVKRRRVEHGGSESD